MIADLSRSFSLASGAVRLVSPEEFECREDVEFDHRALVLFENQIDVEFDHGVLVVFANNSEDEFQTPANVTFENRANVELEAERRDPALPFTPAASSVIRFESSNIF
jgi:hypothetical protein